jgi:hypothetical protein
MNKYKYLVFSYTSETPSCVVLEFDFIRICSTEEQAKAVIQYEFDAAPSYDNRPVLVNDSTIAFTNVLGETKYITYCEVRYDDENQPLMRYTERGE